MIIKKIELRNFQAIKDFSAEFSGNVYFVRGDNELGKTSFLKAIAMLLTGFPDSVLTNGEQKGFAKMVLANDGNQYEVELRLTEANPRGTLSIKDCNTGKKTANISMLQKLLNYKLFDAVEFSRWSESAEGRRKQVQVVKNLMPEPIQQRLSDIDAEISSLKEKRKEANAVVTVLLAASAVAALELDEGDNAKYDKPIDITDLLEQQRKYAAAAEQAKSVREKIAHLEDLQAQLGQRIEQAKAKLEKAKQDYENEIKAIQNDNLSFTNQLGELDYWLGDFEAHPLPDVTQQLEDAQKHNDKYAKVKEYREKSIALGNAEDKVTALNNSITQLLSEKESLVISAELPIAGLNFGEDGLMLNGIPFVAGKVSDSQIMEVAAKLAIASNPTVKVFCIGRGESLGSKRLQDIVKIAHDNGFQGFIEEVKRGQDTLTVEEYTEIN